MLYPGSFPLLTSAGVGWSLLTGRNEVCKEIIWKTNVYEFRRKVNNSWVCSIWYNKCSGRSYLFGWKTRYLHSLENTWLQWPVPCDWQGRQIWLKEVQPFMSKRHCDTVSICLFCSEDTKGPVKAIAKSRSVAVFSLPWGPTWERSGGTILWVQVWDSSGAAGRVGCGTDAWLKACTKSWAFALLLREEGNTLASCLALVSEQI